LCHGCGASRLFSRHEDYPLPDPPPSRGREEKEDDHLPASGKEEKEGRGGERLAGVQDGRGKFMRQFRRADIADMGVVHDAVLSSHFKKFLTPESERARDAAVNPSIDLRESHERKSASDVEESVESPTCSSRWLYKKSMNCAKSPV